MAINVPSNVRPTVVATAKPTVASNITQQPLYQQTTSSVPDMRVKLSAQNPSFYRVGTDAGIMSPLMNTNGMMFPYTPTINIEQSVEYATQALVHSNSDYHAFTRVPNVTFSVTGKFTYQNQAEGEYMLAAIHFLRSASKMNFGATDPQAGTPPPVLLFNGYGTYMFNNARVLLRSHSFSFDEHIDMIKLKVGNGTTWLPAMMNITISLIAQQTPSAWMNTFTLDSYRSGRLLEQGGWF